MRMTEVRTVLLTGPITNDPSIPALRRHRSASFIEIHTDTPHTGIGETYLGYHFPEIVPQVVEFFAPIITNAETLDIPLLRQRMDDCCAYWGRVGLGQTVISGIEAALWDLKGKLENTPVCDLIGPATHQRLPVYATGGPANWPVDRLYRKVDHYLALGFTGFKVSAGFFDEDDRTRATFDSRAEMVEFEARKAESLRQHVGPEIRILLDGHMGFRHGAGQWNLETAKAVLDAVEPFDIFFFEEPLPYTDAPAYGELTRTTNVRVAGGESLTSLQEFRDFLKVEAFDVSQPDSSWIGMMDFVEIGNLMSAQNRQIASHAWGAGASVMQNVHAAFATPNTLIIELPPDAGPLHTEVWGDSLQLVNGELLRPQSPGLGVTLTEDIKARFPFIPGTGEWVSVPGKVMEA